MKSSEESKGKMERRVISAIDAMKVIGVTPQVTRSVLKSLLKAYDNNWEYIEGENYRLLADAIFESDISKDESSKTKKDELSAAHNNSVNNLDRGGSNKKRPGKEIVLNEKNNLGSGQSSVKRPGKEIAALSADVQLATPVKGKANPALNDVKKVTEQKMRAKQEEGHSLNKRVGESNGNGRSKKKLRPIVPEPPGTNSNSSPVVHPPQVAHDTMKRVVNPRDITNGQERHRIRLVCDDEQASNDFPNFHYISHNIVYQKASVPISLARIGDEYCCKDCYGDCLNASIPCACAGETGGEFAYTPKGLLTEGFLDSYLKKYRHTQEHHLHYCESCPLERIKNELRPEKCKGHLIGTFIKECWIKCGCSRQCANRVVQRGIRCQLEVFYTGKRKGWGLRSPTELPRGTFVCEYAGEILTNMELHERTVNATGNEKHTYPVMLDADWASEGILEDEEALCLDATNYGNVARFMNHRCCDPNLVEIPVEIETPDHHYYHVAFFTTRKIEPYEELCWDYGIDFNDLKHPIKAFRCSCASKQCRDLTRRSKCTLSKQSGLIHSHTITDVTILIYFFGNKRKAKTI